MTNRRIVAIIALGVLLLAAFVAASAAEQMWIPRDPFDSPLPFPPGYWVQPDWLRRAEPRPRATVTPSVPFTRTYLPGVVKMSLRGGRYE